MALMKMKDICAKIGSGATPRGGKEAYIDSGISLIRSQNVLDFVFSYDGLAHINEQQANKLNNVIVESGDVLLNITGDSVARACIVEDKVIPARVNQHVAIVRANTDIVLSSYLLYYLQISKPYLLQIAAGGATRNALTKGMIEELELEVPSIGEQEKIVSIIDDLQKKIKQNKEINDNLLQQAKTLFKSWFVDFDPFDEPMIEAPTGYLIPQSLKMVQIQDLPHILETGKRPKGGAVPEGIPSVGAENVKELGVFDASSAKYIPIEFAQTMKKGKIEGYELLLYKDGGKPGTFIPHFSMFGEGFPYEEFYINEHVFKLDFDDRGYNEFAYLYMLTDYPYHWLANNGGKAAIPGINQQNVNEIWIYHPSHPRVQEFCKWIQPIFTTIFTNCAQNMKLAKLRDALLPKLMSGELDVSELDI
ncbi:MAG: restriction endonuclease subunit S [Eubacterium sp.]|nr:restriction endonuclease subunit S [Eubacterium sp.]